MALTARAERFRVLGSTYLRVQLECPVDKTEQLCANRNPVHLYLALDNSGSMAGSAINNAKKAVTEFLEKVAGPDSTIDLDSIHLLVFNHEATDIDLTECDVDMMKAKVSAICAHGGTSFGQVLKAIQVLATTGSEGQAATGQQYFVVFFTDGQDCSFQNQHDKDGVLAAWRKAFDAQGTTCQVHSLGFQQYHDAAFLSALTLCGTEQGTFQYIEDISTQLQPAVDNIQQVLVECAGTTIARVRGKIQVPVTHASLAAIPVVLRAESASEASTNADAAAEAGAAVATSTATTTTTTTTYTGDLYMDQAWTDALPDEGQALVMSVEALGDVHLQVPALQEPSLRDLAPLAVALLRRRIIHWTNSIANEQLKREQIQHIRERELAACRAELQAIVPRLNKLPATSRSAIRAAKGTIMEAAQLCNQFETDILVPALAGTLSNQRIAALNDLAYRNITKSSLKAGLMKRVGANVELMDQIDTQVQQEVENLDLSEVSEDSVREYGICALSCQNYKEALQAGDCLCLSLDIERPEAAIMDPSRLRIKALHPTRVSCESFLDAVSFALNSNSGAGAVEVHGGFQQNTQGQVVPGEGREPITGCLPLFISPQHWAVARHRIKPLLGWMCALDVLGYSGEQLVTVPFLVLAKALEDLREAPSEFRQWVADQVLETCTAVYRMRKNQLLGELLAEGAEGGAPLRYLQGPEQRTVDVVANSRVMLMRLLCAVKEGDVKLTAEHMAGLQKALTEEELRRWPGQELPAPTDAAFDSAVARLLAACDTQTAPALAAEAGGWVQMAVEEVLGREGNEQLESAEVLQEMEGKVDGLVQGAQWGRQGGQPLWQVAEVQRLGKAYEGRVVGLLHLLQDVQQVAGLTSMEAPPTALSELPSQVVAALLVQNMHGIKNADRRQYIADGQYIDPFLQPDEILSRAYNQVVMERVKALVSKVQGERYLRRSLAMGNTFAAATTRQEAAAAVKGWHVGRELPQLLQALLQPTTSIPDVKMELLMCWEEAGQKLRADKAKEGCEVAAAAWKPGRRRVFQFLKVWHDKGVALERAVALFGGVVEEEYLRKQYEQGFAAQRRPAAA